VLFAFLTVIVGDVFLNLTNPKTGIPPVELNVICDITTFDAVSLTYKPKDCDDVEPNMFPLKVAVDVDITQACELEELPP